MSSIFVDARGSEFADGVTLGARGEVVSVNTQRYPALATLRKGMLVRSINGTPVSGAATREEQQRYAGFAGEILIVLAPGARDEFDLSSDEDESDRFAPATGLAPELDSGATRNNAAVVLEAARKCGPGRCIIILNEGANPALPVTLAAQQASTDVMYIDTVARMKTRQKMDDAGVVFKKSLEKGLWIFVEQATKSITFLRKLAECITEVEASGRMHAKSRVFLMCEPHPHFPESLMVNCVTLRSRMQRTSGVTEADLREQLLESKRRVRVLHGDDAIDPAGASATSASGALVGGSGGGGGGASSTAGAAGAASSLSTAAGGTATTTASSGSGGGGSSSSAAAGSSSTSSSSAAAAAAGTTGGRPEVRATRKKVKISSEVNIVHLEKSTFLELSASAHPSADRENVNGEGLTRVAKYTFGSSEKFISLCKVRDGRFAVGTNSGYVVLLDSDGLPMIQFRPHKACVWDVSFASQFDFATACEDGTSTIFNYSLAAQELTTTSVASFQSDVFAVTYADAGDVNSPVLSGGLSATICVLHSDRQHSSFIALGTSIQAMAATHNRRVVVGGGSGACSLIDPERCVALDSVSKHSRKVPAVGSYGDLAATGGFDRMLRLWDIRSGFHLTCERAIAEVVTAVAASERHVVVCSGSDLLVWDVRKMAAPYATKHNAWKDLTRGLVIDGNLIVTASVDGVARFWDLQ